MIVYELVKNLKADGMTEEQAYTYLEDEGLENFDYIVEMVYKAE